MSLDLPKALAEWQEALRLQDWDIKAEILPDIEYRDRLNEVKSDESSRGNSEKDVVHFKADIQINDKYGDQERTLVHELVHILLVEYDFAFDQAVSFAPSEACRETLQGNRKFELEKATNRIARALLKVRDMAQETKAVEPEKAEITE